jgi:hypothetical protein
VKRAKGYLTVNNYFGCSPSARIGDETSKKNWVLETFTKSYKAPINNKCSIYTPLKSWTLPCPTPVILTTKTKNSKTFLPRQSLNVYEIDCNTC